MFYFLVILLQIVICVRFYQKRDWPSKLLVLGMILSAYRGGVLLLFGIFYAFGVMGLPHQVVSMMQNSSWLVTLFGPVFFLGGLLLIGARYRANLKRIAELELVLAAQQEHLKIPLGG